MGWYFKKEDPMGEATGEAYRNTLQATGIPPAGVLAREAIQNSVDAASSDSFGKVRVVFRRKVLQGKSKEALVTRLDLANSIADRHEHLEFQRTHSMEDIRDSSKPLEVLYVEDFGTHGLYGNPRSADSHFRKLLLTLGRSDKERKSKSTGGSYGYGKAVYFASSHIFTVVAHTVFDPRLAPEATPVEERLMGCAYFNAHRIGDQEFTGRAWFGRQSADQPEIIDPFENEAAAAMARDLGFTPRDSRTTGTSMLIIDSRFDLNELLDSVERWWWPRLVDNNLEVQIFDEDQLYVPRPKNRADLKPFIHAYSLASGKAEPTGQHEDAGPFRKSDGVSYGSYGFTVIEEADNDEEVDNELLSTVALMRGPRMVVEYKPYGNGQLRYAGVVVAHDDIDEALKLSEPAAHNRWDPNSDRFRTQKQQKQVKSLLDRVRRAASSFINKAAPEIPDEGFQVPALERLFGAFFRLGPTKPGGPAPESSDPIQIRFVEQPHYEIEGDSLRVVGSCQLSLAPGSTGSGILSEIRVLCQPVEDDGIATADPIPTTVWASDGLEVNGGLVLAIEPDRPEVVRFSSDPYPSDWSVQIDVNVEEVA